MKAVVTEDLSKTYASGTKALRGLNISLEPGEVFGFLGPNGAGKTTAVKLLTGILAPTGGSARVFGVDPSEQPEKIHRFSGVVTEHALMYDHMTGWQNLLFYGAVFGLSNAESSERANALLELVELSEAKDKPLAAYSTGMRQRLSLARALINRPKILFLDEPTAGLDPESVLGVNNMIKNLARNEGTTIFLCTHQLRYAEEICSSYGLIDNGALLAAGSIDALRAAVFSGMTVSIKADRLPEDVYYTTTGERIYEVKVNSEAEIPALVRHIVAEGFKIYHVSARKLSLEEVYFSMLQKRDGKEGG